MKNEYNYKLRMKFALQKDRDMRCDICQFLTVQVQLEKFPKILLCWALPAKTGLVVLYVISNPHFFSSKNAYIELSTNFSFFLFSKVVSRVMNLSSTLRCEKTGQG